MNATGERIREATSQATLGRCARRPAVSAAACVILGVVGHSILPDAPLAYLSAAAIGASIAVALGRRFAMVATASLALAVMLLGLAAAQLERFHFAGDHVVAYTADAERLAEVEMVIDQPPRVLTAPPSAGRPL